MRNVALAMPSKNWKLQTRLLDREDSPHQQNRNCQKIIKEKGENWSRVSDGCLTPRQTCRLTVGLNITLTLTSSLLQRLSTFPLQRTVVWGVVCAVCVVSKESGWLVLPTTSCLRTFMLRNPALFLSSGNWMKPVLLEPILYSWHIFLWPVWMTEVMCDASMVQWAPNTVTVNPGVG
jgi:hypothetical protein